jgi:hypothetical protein
MIKKVMLLALCFVHAVLMLIPMSAVAGEPVIDPSNVTATGTGGLATITAPGEPTTTCESFHTTLTLGFNPSHTKTYTNCHVTIFGFTIACKSAGAPLNNTIRLSGPVTPVYVTDSKTGPGLRLTIESTTISCGSSTPFVLSGSVLGAITNPKCGGESSQMTTSFGVTSGNQNYRQITGTGSEIYLVSETEGSGNQVIAALSETSTATFSQNIRLTCV